MNRSSPAKKKKGKLTDAKVGVDAGVACCTREILVLPVRYVLMCACVSVFFGKTKVYEIHQVSFFP